MDASKHPIFHGRFTMSLNQAGKRPSRNGRPVLAVRSGVAPTATQDPAPETLGLCLLLHFHPLFLQTAIRQMQRTLTLIDMVSNGLTISDANSFLGRHSLQFGLEFRR